MNATLIIWFNIFHFALLQLQAIMADIFVTELGDMLATNNLCDELGVNTLPSPTDLKQKILLKGKIKVKKKVKEYSLYATVFFFFFHPKTSYSTN